MPSFADALQGLFDFLEARGVKPPVAEVRIVEIDGRAKSDESGRLRVGRDTLREPADYEVRFQELMRANLPWINLSCYGVFDDALVIAVETPACGDRGRGTTSLNYSGPPAGVVQNGWSAAEILAFE